MAQFAYLHVNRKRSAEEGTRTPTAFRPPAPKAGASANSATSASAGSFDYTGELDSENNQTRRAMVVTPPGVSEFAVCASGSHRRSCECTCSPYSVLLGSGPTSVIISFV